MVLNFPQNLTIENDEEIAILNCFINYSWKNLTTFYNNNSVQYTWPATGATLYTVNFGDVFLLVSDISNYIQQVMFNNGHYLVNSNGQNVYYMNLVTNYTIYGITLTTTVLPSSLPSGWTNPASVPLSVPNALTPQLVIGVNNFASLTGFNKSTSYPTTAQAVTTQINSPSIPKLSPSTGCFITCNLVNSPNYNTYGNVIHAFTPNVTFGSQIIIQPTQSIWYRAIGGQYNNLTINFTDGKLNPLGVLDSDIVLTLMLRKISK
jgi:hypothetical protein